MAVVVVQGRQSWALAREAYEQRIDRLEERVIRILQDKLRCAPPPTCRDPSSSQSLTACLA